MNVHMERSWITSDWEIWFYESAGRKMGIWRQGENGWDFEYTDPCEKTKPSLRLPDAALEALVREAGKVLQSSDATVAHLADTVAVRDRLLKLVEDGWSAA